MCARTEWFLREFRRAMAGRAAIFPTDYLLNGPPLFGTLFAHRPGHDIAKHAIRRHGLAHAGSATRTAGYSQREFDLAENGLLGLGARWRRGPPAALSSR